jgi:hypothetical protein
MLDEAKKSIQNILNNRVSSPFYGTLIVSWLLWNWKIIYLTFFISEKKIELNKIDFIVANYNNVYDLVWLPIISTILILSVIPFLTNAAFWLDLKFEKWRIDQKNSIEKKQLLTLEQSINLREQVLNMSNKFDMLLSEKNNEINQLKMLVAELEKGKPNAEITLENLLTNKDNDNKEIESLAKKIQDNPNLSKANNVINYHILGSYGGLVNADGITTEILSFFQSNGLVDNKGQSYSWTEKGKKVNRILSNKKFE